MTPILCVCLSATFRFIFCLPLLILFSFSFSQFFSGKILCAKRGWGLGYPDPSTSRQKRFILISFFLLPQFYYFSWQHRIRYYEPCKAKYPMRIGAARKAIRDRKRLLSELSVMLMVIRLLFSHFLFLFFYFFSLFPFFPLTLRGLFSLPSTAPYPFLSNGWRTRRQMRGEQGVRECVSGKGGGRNS